MHKLKLALIALVAVVVVAALTLSCAPAAPKEAGPIKVGVLVELTGPVPVGGLFLDGINLRLDEAGWQVAGRQIELVTEDVDMDPGMALDKGRKLVDVDEVDVIIGPMMTFMMPAVTEYMEPKAIPHLALFEVPKDMLTYSNFFAPAGIERKYSWAGGQYCYLELGHRTAATIAGDTVDGHNFADGFKEAFEAEGGTVLTQQYPPMGTMDYGPYLTQIQAKNPDVVCAFLQDSTEALRFQSQLWEFGLDMAVFHSVSDSIEPVLPELGDRTIGMYGGAEYSNRIDTDINRKFVDAFMSKYEYPPISFNAVGYVSMSVFLEAVKATGGDTSGEKLIEALKKVRLDTPRGPLYFTPEGEGMTSSYIVQIDKEEEHYIWKVIEECPDFELKR